MKVVEMTTSDMISNFRSNFKKSICIFIICVIIGLVLGIINAMTYSPKKIVDETEIEEVIRLEEIDKTDTFYYKEVFYTIKAKNDYLNAYIEYFDKVNLTQSSRAKIESIEHDLTEYQKNIDQAIEFYITTPVVVGEDIEAAINKVYGEELQEIHDEIVYHESVLNEVVSGKYTDRYKEIEQDSLSTEIAMLKTAEREIKAIISSAKSISPYQIQQNNNEADTIIDKNVTELNGIINSFNAVMKEISKTESYEIIYNKNLLEEYESEAGIKGELNETDILENKKGEAIIYAKSIEGLDLKKERFFATFTFFVLFGIFVSLLFGVFYRKESK